MGFLGPPHLIPEILPRGHPHLIPVSGGRGYQMGLLSHPALALPVSNPPCPTGIKSARAYRYQIRPCLPVSNPRRPALPLAGLLPCPALSRPGCQYAVCMQALLQDPVARLSMHASLSTHPLALKLHRICEQQRAPNCDNGDAGDDDGDGDCDDDGDGDSDDDGDGDGDDDGDGDGDDGNYDSDDDVDDDEDEADDEDDDGDDEDDEDDEDDDGD
jgi:hypothetical protein